MRRTASITVALAVTFGGVACSTGGSEAPTCSAFTASTSVQMDDFSYGPNCLQVASGTSVSLDNAGDAPHTFTVEGTDISVDVAAGDTATADLSGVAAGTYTVICTYHPQMKAAIEVA
jgi:plastocyanin